MTEEGNATPATDTASSGASLGAADAVSTSTQVEKTPASTGDIWAQVSQPEPPPAAEPAPAAPAQPATADPAQPAQAEATVQAAQADASTGVEEDPFDKITDPKQADWQAIRANRKELTAKLNEAEPVARRVAEVGGQRVLDFVAPIFQRHETPAAGVSAIAGALKAVVEGDPGVRPLLTQAAYELEPQRFQDWALEDLGIKQKWAAFSEWEKAGKPLPGDQPFPQPDAATGEVTLEDGTVLDLEDSRDKMTYDLLKEKHERGIEDRRRAAEDEKRQQAERKETEAREQRETEQKRHDAITAFAAERDRAFDAAAAQLKFDAGSEAETALSKQLTLSLFQSTISANPAFAELTGEGARLAAEGGTLAQEKGLAVDKLAIQTLANAHSQVMGLFHELHTLRQQAQRGLPVIPKPQNPSADVAPPPPSAPQGQPATAIDDIWASVSGR